MLRALVILLLLANLVFWAWHQPDVAQALGLPRHGEREPERAARQLNPDAVQLLGAAASAAGPAVAPCMQTSALMPEAADALARALRQAGLPADGWSEVRRDVGGRWAVRLGQDEPAARLERRLATAVNLQLDGAQPQRVDGAVQLATFVNAETAEAALARWRDQGLRGGRVVTVEPAQTEVRLRADGLTAESWSALKSATPASGPSWAACAP